MIIIDTDGSVSVKKYDGDDKTITEAIGCRLFDIVGITFGDVAFDMFVDDEGLYRQKDERGRVKYNAKATYLRMTDWLSRDILINWTAAANVLPIAGKVVCLMRNEDGETVDLDDKTAKAIISVIANGRSVDGEERQTD